MWTQIYLSREYPIILGFFVILVIILVLALLGIVLKIIDVMNNRKSRILLERLTQELFDEGENTMSLFDDVVQGAKTPPQGNRNPQAHTYTRILEEAGAQQTGVVEKLNILAAVNAANRHQSDVANFLKDLDGAIDETQHRFEGNAQMYREGALGSAPSTASIGQESAPSEAPPAESQAELAVPEAPSVEPTAEVAGQNGTSAETNLESAELLPELNEGEVKKVLSEMKGVEAIMTAIGITHGSMDYSFAELPRAALESLKTYFKSRSNMGFATLQDKQVFQFLLRVKPEST